MATEPTADLHYWVVFAGDSRPYQPVIEHRPGDVAQNTGSDPHGLAGEAERLLPTIWYVLHLPRDAHDLVAVSPAEVVELDGADRDRSHNIVLVSPHIITVDLAAQLPRPALVLAETAVIEQAKALARARCADVQVEPIDDEGYGPQSLERHWHMLAERCGIPVDARCERPPRWTQLARGAAAIHASSFLLRFGARELPGSTAGYALELRAQIRALAAVGELPENEVREGFVAALDEERRTPATRVALVAAGVAPRYRRLVASKSSRSTLGEDAAFEVLAAHRALTRNGIAVRIADVPDDLFRLLERLELSTRGHPRGAKVLGLLKQIGRGVDALLDDDARLALKLASDVTVFSGFPIGLGILPGDTSPLASGRPLTYRPIVPLTRSLQTELAPNFAIDLTSPRVLIVDAIGDGRANDEIRGAMREGWSITTDALTRVPGSFVKIIRVTDESAIARELAANQYSVLWLCSHGDWRTDENRSGVLIADEPSLLLSLEGQVPPLVLLSACQVVPRGAGPVSVVELLLRNQAAAVLGAMVPVDSRRNSILFARLFVAIAYNQHRRFRNLADLWWFIARSHVLNDVVTSSPRLAEWAFSKDVVRRFRMQKSPARLRAAHVYADTIAILQELADEDGVGATFRAVMASPGFFPETALYALFGSPERLVVR